MLSPYPIEKHGKMKREDTAQLKPMSKRRGLNCSEQIAVDIYLIRAVVFHHENNVTS